LTIQYSQPSAPNANTYTKNRVSRLSIRITSDSSKRHAHTLHKTTDHLEL
jgi:hypothetical protein